MRTLLKCEEVRSLEAIDARIRREEYELPTPSHAHRSLRILVYSSVFYPGVGGIENSTRLLIEEFVKAGHEVKVVTEQVQDPAHPFLGIEVVHSSQKSQQIAFFRWADVLYMPNITLKGVWLLMLGPRKKWVISHNDFHLMYARPAIAAIKRLVMGCATRHIAVSRSVAKFVGHDAQVIHCCYDDQIFKLYPEEARAFDFLFVGRLVSQKGCDLLIEACSRLRRPFTLNIVGEGDQRECLQAKVQQHGLADRVKFHGALHGEELARFMNRHRVMVVPSRGAEGFGVVVLEGLASGCHVIAADAGGLAEAVDEHGQLFPVDDAQRLQTLLDESFGRPAPQQLPPALVRYLGARRRDSVARQYIQALA
ncbi:glycosyltransferase family 4 protein [Variovorax sp. LARHSF232]